MTQARILIADDHVMFAQGLASLLEDEFALVGSVGDGQNLIAEAERLQPDVIVVDISMPVMNGLESVRRLKEQGNAAQVVFLTMHADDRLLTEAFRCGGTAYVLKQSAGEDLIFAIREVLSGRTYVSPFPEGERRDAREQPGEKQKLTLTPRQRDVLELVVAGYTMKEIAVRLGISTRTAESHKYEMMQGLGVQTTAELIQYAAKLGYTAI